jgi:hypothetical protein
MKRVLQDERGMALALAIVALVIVGALVAGALFSGTQEQRMGENTRFSQQAFGVAEVGAYEAIGNWDRVGYNSRRPYPLDSFAPIKPGMPGTWAQAPSKTGSYNGSVYKLNNTMYLIDVTGRDTASRANALRGGGNGSRLGILVRIVPLNVDIQAAFTTGAPVTWGGGNVFVNGADNTPPAWPGCAPAGASLAAVRAKSIGDLGSSNGQYVGTPDSIITPTLSDSTFTNYGYTNYATLTSQANIQLAPGTYAPAPVVAGGVCQTVGQPTNWGDGNTRTNPCGSYFPIVWLGGGSSGSSTITDGQGQGVLLVDGNLVAGGSFTFYGLIVVRGQFSTVAGANVKIYGGLLAKGANFSSTAASGNFVVNWSSCAMTQALQGTGVGALGRSRNWLQLY